MIKVYELIEMLKHLDPEAIVHIKTADEECSECGNDLCTGWVRADRVLPVPHTNVVRIGG